MVETTAEQGVGSIKTPQALERAYVTVYRSSPDSPAFGLGPGRYAEGRWLAMYESAKRKALQSYLPRLREEYERGEAHIPQTKLHLLDASPEGLEHALKEGSHKKKGTYKVWTTGPGDIVMHVGRQVSTGSVPSRSSGRMSNVLADWTHTLMTPTGTEAKYQLATEQCRDFISDAAKGILLICAHMAAGTQRAFHEWGNPNIPERMRRVKFAETKGPIYMPFNITDEDAADVVFRRYALGEDIKHIDKQMLDREDIYEPAYLEAINRGSVTFESIPQKRNRLIMPTNTERRVALVKRVDAMKRFRDGYVMPELRRLGFQKASLFYSPEFKGTKYETMCETWQKGDVVLRYVINMELPPLFVIYRLGKERQIFYEPDKSHPFVGLSLAGEKSQENVDDRTRLKAERKVFIPGNNIPVFGSLPVPDEFKHEYLRFIADNFEGDPFELMRKLTGVNQF